MDNNKIILLFRKRNPQFNSIEGVFNSIFHEISKSNKVEIVNLKRAGGIYSILYNLFNFRKEKNCIYHITGHDNYMALRTGRNTVLTIHDIGSAFSGNFLRVFLIKLFWFWLPAIIVKQITVISEFSKSEVLELIPFAKKKIRVIHNPLNNSINYSPRVFNEKYPTILHLGTKSNKNLEKTIEALKGIKCKLVIIGKLSTVQEQLLHQNAVDYLNEYHITDEQIIEHYKNCDIVSFISFYEGFGLPILEAQATGRPVITSIRASMPEVAGNGAILVDPSNITEIRNAFLKIISDKSIREELVKQGLKNAKRFKPEKIANLYQEVYSKF